MDIGTNELTRPFRIPRRKKNEDKITDGTHEKTKRRRLGGESDIRSPLVSASSLRKNDSAFSSRIIPPTKKKSVQEHLQTSTHSKKSKPGELFERILDNMVNPPKERRKDTPQDDIDEAGPSNNITTNVSTSSSKKSAGLTREELERHQIDNSACFSFMQREGLMERLLGHKMLTGRVDSHVVLGFLPFDPKDSATSKNHNNSNSKMDDFPSICEPSAIPVVNEERRGPKTPPGSPGHCANSSVLSSRGVGSASPSSPPPPPPAEDTFANSVENSKLRTDETPDLIAEMAELTKLPHNQLAECLGEELQKAMKQVDHKVLLETLKDALLKVGEKNDERQQRQRTASKDDIRTHPVEMDLESNKSVGGNDALLPPPPPAPHTPPSSSMIPPLPGGFTPNPVALPPPSTVLPTPPPPPPLVMLHPGATPQVIVNTSATGSACASAVYPYFPPPPPPQQLPVDQVAKASAVVATEAPTGTPIIFAGMPYATSLVATSALAVPTIPPMNLTSHPSAVANQSTGLVSAVQNIRTPSYVGANPTVVAPYQAALFTMKPAPSLQSSTTASIASINQYSLTTFAPNNRFSSTNATADTSSNSAAKSNDLPHHTVLHPYASATNYNISGVSVAPYSTSVNSSSVSVVGNTFPAVAVSPILSQKQQSAATLNLALGSRPTHSSQHSGAGFYSTTNGSNFTSNSNVSEIKTTQSSADFSSHQSRYQATNNYSPPSSQQQPQQEHSNPNFSGISSNGTVLGICTSDITQQKQSSEKPFQANFSRPPPLRMQTSLESLPSSSTANFSGRELNVPQFFSSTTRKTKAFSSNEPTTSRCSSSHSHLSTVVTSSAMTEFAISNTSDESILVPSSQNVIKTLLSALSIPHSSGGDSVTTRVSAAIPNESTLTSEMGNGDREVDFCWPPASMGDRWNKESGAAAEQSDKKRQADLLQQAPSSNGPRMMFFDQVASLSAPSVGSSLIRPRPPVPPPNRMPPNKVLEGPPRLPTQSGMQRMVLSFRPPGQANRPSFPANMPVKPLRPRISPPFLARRPPFPFRPPPPGMRLPRPPFPR